MPHACIVVHTFNSEARFYQLDHALRPDALAAVRSSKMQDELSAYTPEAVGALLDNYVAGRRERSRWRR
jgi:hypothetical protein